MSADRVGAPGLPSGVVSLLFSDVEGSTRLVRELGDAWGAVLARQRELCRAAWAAHGGVELGTEGDSFFVVFADAGQAVAAAVAAQRALGAEPWLAGAVVRVRMGVHSGSPARQGEGYVGMDVHKAARIAACAHGGQVLVSAATAALAGLSDGSDGADRVAVDLGEHQLQDLPGRTRLFQVNAEGLAHEFATIRSLGAAGSLPDVLTPVIGRDGEIAEVADLIGVGERLVTLTGPGGTGKTRLAVAVAAAVAGRFVDGVFFVPLAAARSATDTWSSIARVLEVPADGQIPPGFFDHVAHRRMLLVLDNLEQIDGADDVVRELLAEARHVQILATSRRPLHVAGETEFPVAPLPLPAAAALDAVEQSGAVQMFVDHARRTNPRFALTAANAPDVGRLCAALDGLPLAIELAAARVKLLSPSALLARIDKALDLASADRSRDTRQRTIRGAIAWSHDLLPPVHRRVFEHLGVFEGGAAIDALAAVLPHDALASVGGELALEDVIFDLVDASLVTVSDGAGGEPRISTLVTVHRFAADQLRANDGWDAAVVAHSQYYYDAACAMRVMGDNRAKRAAFRADLANLQALADRRSPHLRHLVDLDRPEYRDGPVIAAHVVLLLVWIAVHSEDHAQARAWLDQVRAEPDDGAGLALTSVLRGLFEWDRGDPDAAAAALGAAVDWYEENLETFGPDVSKVSGWTHPSGICRDALWNLSYLAYEQEDRVALRKTARRLEVLDEFLGVDYLGSVQAARALQARLDGDHAGACAHLHAQMEELRGFPQARSVLVAVANDLTWAHLAAGDLTAARVQLWEWHDATLREAGPRLLALHLCALAAVVATSHPLAAARAFGCADGYRVVEAVGEPLSKDERHARATACAAVTTAAWDEAADAGREREIVDLCRELADLDPDPRPQSP